MHRAKEQEQGKRIQKEYEMNKNKYCKHAARDTSKSRASVCLLCHEAKETIASTNDYARDFGNTASVEDPPSPNQETYATVGWEGGEIWDGEPMAHSRAAPSSSRA